MLAGNNSRRLIRDIDSTARLDYGLARARGNGVRRAHQPDHAPRPSQRNLSSTTASGTGPTGSIAMSHQTLAALLGQPNPVLRGWCNYFRHGVKDGGLVPARWQRPRSAATFPRRSSQPGQEHLIVLLGRVHQPRRRHESWLQDGSVGEREQVGLPRASPDLLPGLGDRPHQSSPPWGPAAG